MSQRQVAEAMGVTRSRISQIESTEGTALALEVSFRDQQGDVAASLFIPAGIVGDVPAPAHGS